jgi:hypothetical protein
VRPEDVERLEVELRRVDADLLVGVVDRDVAEAERRLLPVLVLEVRAGARVLDLGVLGLRVLVASAGLDVADVAVEGGDHALLRGRELLLLELRLVRRGARLATLRVTRQVAGALLVRAALVLLGVDVLVAEDGGVRGLGGLGALRVLGDDGVERGAALGPVLLEVEQVRHRVLDLEDVRPVLLEDAGELELRELVLREAPDDLVVELGGELHRLRVAVPRTPPEPTASRCHAIAVSLRSPR